MSFDRGKFQCYVVSKCIFKCAPSSCIYMHLSRLPSDPNPVSSAIYHLRPSYYTIYIALFGRSWFTWSLLEHCDIRRHITEERLCYISPYWCCIVDLQLFRMMTRTIFYAALQMSMQEAAAAAASASQSNADMSKVLGDQSFVSSVLSSVRQYFLHLNWSW